MPLKPYEQPPPCPPGRHSLHPHGHTRYEDAGQIRVKPCNGRFWCGTCRDWCDAPACKDAPALQPFHAGS